jgi:TPR repeat protein
MKRLLLTLVLLWPVVGLADFAAGLEAYNRGDYATAMREFRSLAEAGDAVAQNFLGQMYSVGEGVPKDGAEAVQWFRKAAEQGHDISHHFLGAMYHEGVGAPKDFVQAYAWYNLAATQGRDGAAPDRGAVRVQMSSAQIAEAQKLSRELCAKIPNCAK